MSSTEIRGRVAVDANVYNMANGLPAEARQYKDGTLAGIDWNLLKVMEGKVFQLQVGAEATPVASTTTIDDELVWGLVDVPSGVIAIPVRAEAHVATWGSSTLVLAMLEVDRSKVRYSSGGTAFVPLNLNCGSSAVSGCSAYAGTDITSLAKSTLGSIEVARQAIGEDNIATATGAEKCFIYANDPCPPYVVGPGSMILHFGATTGDVTGFGLIKWIELTV